MTPTWQKEESNDSKRSAEVSKSATMSLRSRFLLNMKKNKSVDAKYNLEVLCKLLCKPVSVSLTRLPISELNESLKTVSNKIGAKRKLRSTARTSYYTVKRKRSRKVVNEKDQPDTEGKIVEENDAPNAEEPKKNVRPRTRIRRKRKASKDHTEEADSLKPAKHPCVKLQRIDKVINKIAQTFAKVFSDGDTKSDKVTQHEEEAGIETNALTSRSSPVNNKTECSENNETRSSICESRADDNVSVNQNIEGSDTLEINYAQERTRRRIIFDSDANKENNDAKDISGEVDPREIEKSKADSPEKAVQTFVNDGEHNESGTLEESGVRTTGNEEVTVQIPPQELDVPEESRGLVDQQNSRDERECVSVTDTLEDAHSKSDPVIERNEEDNASECVPSEIDLICTSEDICPRLKDNGSVNVEEPASVPSICNEIQDQMYESFMLEENLENRYKLFENFRVLLIKLDSIKTLLGTEYSATEIEQLTNKYINVLLNTKSLHTTPQVLPFNSVYSENSVAQSKLDPRVESSNIYEDNSSASIVKNVENTDGACSNIYDKSPRLTDKVQERQDDTLINRSNSCKREENLSCYDSKSVTAPETAPSSPKKPIIKNFKFSSRIKYNENREKSARILKRNSMVKSCSELQSSASKEKPLRKLSHSENSEETSTNLESTETTNVKKYNKVLPKMIANTLVIKGNMKGENVSNNNDKILFEGKKVRVVKLYLKPVNASDVKITGNKNGTESTSSMASPVKHNAYKCIVCDLRFENYSLLQQHLPMHRQKQNNASASHAVPSEEIPTVEEHKEAVSAKSGAEGSSEPKESREATSKSPGRKKSKAPLQKEQRKKEKEGKGSSLNKGKSRLARRRMKLLPRIADDATDCGICAQKFPTKTDLAAHIFLHTESELQKAYNSAMQKMKGHKKERNTGKKAKEDITKESASEVAENVTESVIDTVKKASETVETEVNCSKSSKASEQDKSLTAPGLEAPVEKKASDTFNATKSTVSNESVSNKAQALPVQNGTEKSRPSKAAYNKRGFVICQCHNRSEISDNSLQIEIVLLCHTCRVLFRSIECFETHYRLPEFTLCNQNRRKCGRSPNLFCATCGMVFSSVQDVRHHLEIHARFKQNFTMDFRCNICKVVFIGIGSLFYIHWSKHAKDAFWVASEQSFPKSSLIKSRSANVNVPVDGGTPASDNVRPAETYIHVAEHICCNCKVPFVTADDLKKHESSCKVPDSTEDTAVPEATVEKTRKHCEAKCNLTKKGAVSRTVQKIRKKDKVVRVPKEDKAAEKIQKSPTIRITCTLCYDIFSEKLQFFRHMRSRHNFIPEPEFVCVSLTAIKRAFICTVCMEISEDILQFEEHWLKHSTNQPFFVCLICNEEFDILKSVTEHIKTHEGAVKKGVLPCKVVYQAAEFICTLCNIGFESRKVLTEHSIVHKVNFLTLQQKNKKTPDQGCSTSISEISNPPNLMKLKELVVAREKAISAEKQADAANNQIVERTTEDSMKPKKDLERERLIKILEGKEDSENELTIDLIECSQECSELQREGGNTGKSLITASTSVAEPDVIICESHEEISDANLSSSNNSQGSLSENKEEAARPKKNRPVKPKPGFLRVRNIAELMDNTKVSSREVFGDTPENTESPEQNTSTRPALSQDPIQPSQQTNRRILVSKTTPPPLVVSQKPTNTNRQATQSSTVLASNQSSQWHSNVIQERSTSIQSSTSAYHKNLPACNIIQRSVAVPRSSILRRGKVPVKAATSSSDAQNVEATPVTTYATAERPQVSSRSVIKSPAVTSSASSSQLNHSYQVHSTNSGNRYTTGPNTQSASNEQNRESIAQRGHDIVDDTAAVAKSNATSNNPNCKQPQTNCTSSTNFYQYSNIGVKNLGNNSQRPMQSQQIMSNQPMARATPLYYKNTTGGGMSIVINQTTPAVQSIPTMGMLPNQGQQHVYQPLVYANPVTHMNPYMQQPQNMNNFSGLNNMYPMAANQYEVPATESLTTYEVMLQAAEGLVCSYCPNAVPFMSDELLQLHIDSAHNYECDICNQRLYSFHDLTLHRTKHRFMKRRI